MCDCADLNYTDEWGYPRPPTGYPPSYEQGYLPLAAGCAIFASLDAAPAGSEQRVEIAERAQDGKKVALTGYLRDPMLRAMYAPFIPELQGQGMCGK
jgi:hypothetical protein